MKHIILLITILSLAISLCACGRTEPAPTTRPTVTSAPTEHTTRPHVTEPATKPMLDPTIDTNIPDPSVDTSMPDHSSTQATEK